MTLLLPQGTTVPVCLRPLDVLFFRDGRPFGAATRASTDLPQPQTLAGAISTALLQKYACDFDALATRVRSGQCPRDAIRAACGEAWIADVQVRGPWLAWRGADGKGSLDVLLPMPAILHAAKDTKDEAADQLYPLHPFPRGATLPGWTPPEAGVRPLWLWAAKTTEAARGYLGRAGLEAFLAGKPVLQQHVVDAEQLFARDHRTGIGIQPDRLTSEEGQIYMASFLALNPAAEVCLYAEVQVPGGHADALDGISMIPFGGEGRRVAVERQDSRFSWPQVTPDEQHKPLLLLTSPGLFDEPNWRPACLNGRLVSAAVPGAVAVSGWDLARGGPKPTRFAAAAGSVYFLDTLPPSLPDTLADREDDRRQGWGCYLQGVWTDDQ